MTQKAIHSKFLVPTVSAIAFGIMVLIGVVYLAGKYPQPNNQAQASRSATASPGSAAPPNSDGRLWRVHVLLR
jgi:hypothetical protein